MTTTAKRQRQREGRLARLEAERKAAQRAARKRRIVTGVVVGALILAALAVVAVVGGDDGEEEAAEPEATVELDQPEVTVPEEPATELGSTDLEPGEGPRVREGQQVSVRYVGRSQATGEVFDSNFDAPEPFTFTIGAGDVIQGWDQGVAGMRPGGRRQLVIPGELAYGEQGRPPDIAENDTLVFVIDLISAEPAPEPTTPSTAPTPPTPEPVPSTTTP